MSRKPKRKVRVFWKLLAIPKRGSRRLVFGAFKNVLIASRVFVLWNCASAVGVFDERPMEVAGMLVDEMLSKTPNTLDSLNRLSTSTSNASVYLSELPKRYR